MARAEGGATDPLLAARAQVVADWQRFTADAISEQEVTKLVDALVVAIRARSVGGGHPPITPSPLAHQLLVALRSAHLAALVAPVGEAALANLRGIDSLREELAPNWSERFQERLGGPTGLELIVEVAHDLRSPLTSILFLAETISRGRSGPLTPLQERQMALIYAAAFGLNAVASDVIELVRGGHRLADAERKPFAFSEMLESVQDIVRPLAEEKKLSLSFSGPAGDHRLGHPAALNRVLLNLTTNALKFTTDGGVMVRVEADPAEPERVICTVEDSGRGIPDVAMAMLFEPFRRRQQIGDYSFSGSGLGLSICRKLVEAMGSTLEVATTQGVGTRFSFAVMLPLVDQNVLLPS